MADISILSRLINGIPRNVDFTTNTLVTSSVKVGGASPTELTKAILDKLILINTAADADGTFDARYTKIADLSSTTASKGASLVGVNGSAVNYTAASATVEAHLAGIDSALATAGAGANTTLSNLTGPTAINMDLHLSGNKIQGVGELNNKTYTQTLLFSFTANVMTVDPATDWIVYEGHGLTTGDQINFVGADLPAPLLENTQYYAETFFGSGSDKIRIYPTYADALAQTNVINITTEGSGTVEVEALVVTNADLPILSDISMSNGIIKNLTSLTRDGGGEVFISAYGRQLMAGSLGTEYPVVTWSAGYVDMNAKKITNLPTPAADSEAATKKYVDDINTAISGTYLKLDGSSVMAGDIELNGNIISRVSQLNNVTITPSAFPTAVFTADGTTVDTTNDWLVLAGNSFSNEDELVFTSATLPAPLVAATVYYAVKGLGDPDYVGISLTPSGALIDLTTTGSGSVSINASVVSNDPIVIASELDLSSGKIINLDNGTVATDAATFGQMQSADALKVSKAGDTMSGNLAMGNNKVTGLAAPSANGDALRFDQLGANSGIATLDAGGKIPASQLPNSVMEYKGNYNASTNSPTLADGAGNAGDVYRVNVAGSQDYGSGSISLAIGDWIVYSGTIWEKSLNSNAVVTVNGQTGIVVLDTDDIAEGAALYFTDERAQDAIGAMLQAAASKVQLTYTDGTPELKAEIVAGSLVNADINASAAIAYSKLNLTTSIVNGDINASAAIAYSKLNLATSIVNADINAAAAIAYSKLNLSSSIVDADVAAGAAVAYSKLALTASIVNADIATGAAIAYSKLALTASIVNADIATGAAIAYSKLNLSGSVVAADLAANSVTEAKIISSALGSGLTGGSGTVISVTHAPVLKKTFIAGESFAANTSFAVRIALTGETAGRVYKADYDATTTDNFYAIGMIEGSGAAAKTAGNSVDVVLVGTVTLGSSDTAFAAGKVGQPVHLKASGATDAVSSITYAANQASYRVGVVETTSTILVGGMQLLGIN